MAKTTKRKSFHGRGTVKSRRSEKYIRKKGKKTCEKRPSARAEYNAGCPVGEMVYYNNHWHALAIRNNGSPYWKRVSIGCC